MRLSLVDNLVHFESGDENSVGAPPGFANEKRVASKQNSAAGVTRSDRESVVERRFLSRPQFLPRGVGGILPSDRHGGSDGARDLTLVAIGVGRSDEFEFERRVSGRLVVVAAVVVCRCVYIRVANR